MFTINGIYWRIKWVHPQDNNLLKEDGTYTLGVCDNTTKIISLSDALEGRLLKKVLTHEIVHAAMFSYSIHLSIEQEEVIADIIATYGEEIINITDKVFKKLRFYS